MKKLFFLILPIFLLSCESKQKRENPNITEKELIDHVKYLSSDSLKGRLPGTLGCDKAAEYIKNKFLDIGLEPIDSSYYQNFELITGIRASEKNSLKIDNNTYKLNSDFVPSSFSGNGTIEGKIVFIGYGTEKEYKSVDVQNHIILLFAGKESQNRHMGAKQLSDRDKVMLAQDKGAIGALFISKMEKADDLPKLKLKEEPTEIPVIYITKSTAKKIIGSKSTSKSFQLNKTAKATTELTKIKTATKNVLALLKGSDPKLKNEVIIVGAHYDHLGLGGFGSSSRKPDTSAVHNGADDNASGVSGLIEIAEKLSANNKNIKRSLLFIAFSAEEKGLLGSKHFVNNPPINPAITKAMINLDMIGRLRNDSSLQIGGVGTSLEAERILKKLNRNYQFKLKINKEGYGPSDHASFYGKDIPVFFISTGAHLDYHTPKDDWERINTKGLKKVSLFSYHLTFDLANRDSNLTFQEAGPKVKATRSYGKVTLGFMPDFTYEGKGVRADFVTPEKPAHNAGMKNKDIIIAIDGNKINNINDYMYRLKKLSIGQTINVEVRRNGKIEVLIVQL